MKEANRLLEPERLPKTLWDTEKKILRLPGALALAYETLLDRYSLFGFVLVVLFIAFSIYQGRPS